MIEGFLVINKPTGVTSHDIVSLVRRTFKLKKVGHTGTLDPFATGVLPVALGEGTKAIQFLDESIKEYRAVMRLGETTDTEDCTGTILERLQWQHLEPSAIFQVAERFVGVLNQVPPMYSALKVNGTPLYALARKGHTIERQSRQITVFSIVVDRIAFPDVTFTVRCSRGTYVRTLAADMGASLGCGAHLVSLERTVSGPFTSQQAVTPEALSAMAGAGRLPELLIPANSILGHLRPIVVTAKGAVLLSCGVVPGEDEMVAGAPVAAGEKVRFLHDGRLVAVVEHLESPVEEGGKLRIMRVFNESGRG